MDLRALGWIVSVTVSFVLCVGSELPEHVETEPAGEDDLEEDGCGESADVQVEDIAGFDAADELMAIVQEASILGLKLESIRGAQFLGQEGHSLSGASPERLRAAAPAKTPE